MRLDVTDEASIRRAREATLDMTDGEGIDVLVNNAGYGALGPTELVTDDDLRAQYDVNVFGVMAVTRAFLPEMRARGAGRIVNVSSVGGLCTMPLFGVYSSTKFALEALSDALRMELAPFGLHVSVIEPGVVHTGFHDRLMREVAKYRTADSPYAPVLEDVEAIQRVSEKTGVDPACVSRAIERAATARRPKARYVAPRRAQGAVGVLNALPTRWSDFLMRSASGFTRRRLTRGGRP